jgi:hypothetical protein
MPPGDIGGGSGEAVSEPVTVGLSVVTAWSKGSRYVEEDPEAVASGRDEVPQT